MSDQTPTSTKSEPTIKGIFVKSHIDSIKKAKGEDGLKLLEEKYGSPLIFKNADSIPVRDEVRLLECATEILSPDLPKEQVSFEAGRLHFKDFLTTPFARILFPFFKNQFKTMMLQSHNIAGHIFEGVTFTAVDLGENSVKVIMKNNDYPLAHFQGLLQEWMNYSELHGNVEAVKRDDAYEYTMKW